MVDFTILVPAVTHPAIEERYAFAQSRLLLSKSCDAQLMEYEPTTVAQAMDFSIETEFVVVLTDPLLVTPTGLASNLVEALAQSKTDAVVPTVNESAQPEQRATPFESYLTLSQLEEQATRIQQERTATPRTIYWSTADPGIFAIRTDWVRKRDMPMPSLLAGLRTTIVPNLFAHRFASQRGQLRQDLLDRIPGTSRSILEFGCGEGVLASALKERQTCRVVGVELDPASAEIARSRVDLLLTGDIRQLVDELDERFDFIVGGDVVEHVDDPWTLLRELRRVAAPGARILLSLPNLACWPVVRDLMRGRFDYVYMGITCAGHLRFFTRRTIEEMIEISGWKLVSISPQGEFRTPGYDAWLSELRKTALPYSEADLLAPGYYVIAENDRGDDS